MILTLAQTKGGVGKTTLALNIAIARARAGRDVLLVDADEQGTASDFTALRTEQLGKLGYTAVALSGKAVRTQVLQFADKYQDIIIDAGGRDTAGLRAALTVADVALVPFQPRSFDVWTLYKVAALIAEARAFNDHLAAFAILNFADAQGEDNATAAGELKDSAEIRFLNCPIGRRKAYPNAAAEGKAVFEPARRDPKAIAEMEKLIATIYQKDIAKVA
jgi:chromosome partitioning protein